MNRLYKYLTTILIITIITSINTMNAQNPFLKAFDTPYQSVPFSKIKTEHYAEALDEGLKQQESNIKAICNNQYNPTFENTIVALEHCDEILSRTTNVLFNLAEADTNDDLVALTQKYSPLLTEASNRIFQNKELFERVKYVYSERKNLNLDTEDSMLLEQTYIAFVRCGAELDENEKKKFAEISSRLSLSTLNFGQNVLKETNDYKLIIDNKDDLEGLPDYIIEAARIRAKENGVDGDKWLFDLSMPSYFNFMKYSAKRNLREQLYLAYNSKGNHGNQNDNKTLVKQIVNDRLAIANLLGYKKFADYKLERTMAESSENVYKLLNELLTYYKPVAMQEFDRVQNFARIMEKQDDFDLQAWDWSYYSEKLKEQQFQLNDSMLKPYFELEKVKQGVFGLAGKLYGLKFEKAPEIDVYHKDVDAYKVSDADGRFMAVLYTDFFPRKGKQGGAWMTEFRGQRVENGQNLRPLISIVMNFTPPIEDTPSLLTFSEVETFLHEFGHALHGMLADTKYASLSGTNVYRDFVELPSQLMENFSTDPGFLDMAAKHYETGAPIPMEMIEKIKAAENFNVAYACVRQLNFGYIDMAWHSITEPFDGNPEQFENKASKETSMFPVVKGTCISTAFNHIFSGGYAAGYYSYKWAEVLDADAYSVFKEHGGIDPETASRFRNEILKKGGTEHPMILYKRFKGSEPTIDALLERNGIKK